MQTFETPGSVSLQIKLPSGRVVVTTVDEPRTTVEVVARGRRGQDAIDEIDITMHESAGRHELRIEQKDKFRWGPIQITWGGDFECHVTCPPGADLEFGGGSTDLRVEGELGEVAASTASGDIRLQSTRGDLQVKTASGDVLVATIAGEASLVTISGDVDVARVGGALTVRAVSGDVTIGAIDSELGVSTTSGDIEIRAVRDGDVRVNSVSGDVRLGVARGTRVWIDAASVSGKLESELGLEDHELGADVDAAVVPLHVKTVSGDVSIVRAVEALAT